MRSLLVLLTIGTASVSLLFGATRALSAAPAAGSGQPVVIEMTVPADAAIWFDGNATTLQGRDRRFSSPPLSTGVRYSYEIRVRWTDRDQVLERTRRLSFQAGDQVRIDLIGTADPSLQVIYKRNGATEDLRSLSAIEQSTSLRSTTPFAPADDSRSYGNDPGLGRWQPDPFDWFTTHDQ